MKLKKKSALLTSLLTTAASASVVVSCGASKKEVVNQFELQKKQLEEKSSEKIIKSIPNISPRKMLSIREQIVEKITDEGIYADTWKDLKIKTSVIQQSSKTVKSLLQITIIIPDSDPIKINIGIKKTDLMTLEQKAALVIKTITVDDINKAITRVGGSFDQNTLVNNFNFPNGVTLEKEGMLFTVNLPVHNVNSETGIIDWQANITFSSYDIKRTLVGQLTGFRNKNSAKKIRIEKIKKIIKTITSQDINSKIIKKQGVINSSKSPGSYTLPDKIILNKGGFNFVVNFKSHSINDAIGTIEWHATVTESSENITESISGTLSGFQDASARQLQKLSLINDAMNKITSEDIQHKIALNDTISESISANNFNFPTSVTVTKDGFDFIVAITKEAIDNNAGTITWTSSISNSETTQTVTNLSGKLIGFQTSDKRHNDRIRLINTAMDGITANDIQNQILVSNSINSSEKANNFNFPTSVTVTKDGFDFTVAITKGSVDNDAGTISWTSHISHSDSSRTVNNVSGTLTGFQTAEQRRQIRVNAINTAMNKISVSEIESAIEAISGTPSTTSHIQDYTIPNSVTVTKDGFDFTVAITKGSVDNNAGTIAWTSSISNSETTQTVTNLSGIVSGFETQAIRHDNEIAKMRQALNSISDFDINSIIKPSDAIIAVQQANNFNFPHTVSVTKDGFVFVVSLTKGSVDNDAGTISWTSSITNSLTNETKTDILGTLTGFQTAEQRNQNRRSSIITTMTSIGVSDITSSIISQSAISSSEEANNFNFPTTVTVTKFGFNFIVTLTKGTVDNDAGTISWTSSISNSETTQKVTSISGTLTGFQTAVQRRQIRVNAINAVMNTITASEIQAKIVAAHAINSSTEANNYNMTNSITITKGGFNFTVAITKGSVDNNAGTIAWTSSISNSETTQTVTNLSGTLTGFQTAVQRRQIRVSAIKAAMNTITASEIQAKIVAAHAINSSTEANNFNFPTTVTVTKGGFNFTVAITKGSVDNNAGTIAWTSSISNSETIKEVTNLSGTLTGFQTAAQRRQIGMNSINTIMNKITVHDIEVQIVASSGEISASTEANNYNMTNSVTVTKGGFDFTVAITKGSVDNNAGTIAWTSSISNSETTQTVTNLSGTLTGFSTASDRNMMNKYDENKINGLIKENIKQIYNKKINEFFSIDVSNLNLVQDFIGNSMFMIRFTKWDQDNSLGEISWTVDITEPTYGKKTISGKLNGFKIGPSHAEQRIIDINAVMNTITASEIQAKIVAAHAINSSTEANNYNMTNSITITKGGFDFTVAITKGSVDNNAGTIAWTSSISNSETTQTVTNLSGTLTGFQTAVQRRQIRVSAIKAAMNTITASEIQAKIVSAHAINSSTEANNYNMTNSITITKGGFDFIVAITKGAVDNNAGTIAWTSSISNSETIKEVTNLSGILRGFKKPVAQKTFEEVYNASKLSQEFIEKYKDYFGVNTLDDKYASERFSHFSSLAIEWKGSLYQINIQRRKSNDIAGTASLWVTIENNNRIIKRLWVTISGFKKKQAPTNIIDPSSVTINITESGEDGSGTISVTVSNSHVRVQAINNNGSLSNGDMAWIYIEPKLGWKFSGGKTSHLMEMHKITKLKEGSVTQGGVTRFIPFGDLTLNSQATGSILQYAQTHKLKNFMAAFVYMKNGRAGIFPGWGSGDHIDILNQIGATGTNVGVSFGGANAQGTMPASRTYDVNALVNIYEGIFNKVRNLKFMDFDVEGGNQNDSGANSRRAQALRIFKQRHPEVELSVTVATSPGGPTAGGYRVISSLKGVVNVVNIMAMDYGFKTTNSSMSRNATSAARGLASWMTRNGWAKNMKQAYGKVGVIPMIGQNDSPGEIYDLNAAKDLIKFARKNGLATVSMWSMTRDHSGWGGGASPINSSIQSGEFGFTELFKTFDKNDNGNRGSGNKESNEIVYKEGDIIWSATGTNGHGSVSATAKSGVQFDIMTQPSGNSFSNGDKVQIWIRTKDNQKIFSGAGTAIQVEWTVRGLSTSTSSGVITLVDDDLTWTVSGSNGEGTISVTPKNGIHVRVQGFTPKVDKLSNGETISVILATTDGWTFNDGTTMKLVSWTVKGLSNATTNGSTKFIPFGDFTLNGTERSKIVNFATNGGIKNFMAAFAFMRGGQLAMSTWEDINAIYGDINRMARSGVNIGLSFGGAFAQGKMPAQKMYNEGSLLGIYNSVVRGIPSLKYMDFDIEGGNVGDRRANELRARALKAFKIQHPNIKISITVATTQSGPTYAVYNLLSLYRGIADTVNLMTMDYGRPVSNSGMERNAESAATGLANWMTRNGWASNISEAYGKVGIIPMIGQNDSAGEIYGLDQAKQLVRFAKQKGLATISMWSMTRDHSGWGSRASSTSTSIQSGEFGFAKVLSTVESGYYSTEMELKEWIPNTEINDQKEQSISTIEANELYK